MFKEDKDLVIDGILHPENLRYSSAYRSSGYGGDGHTLHAVTRDQKAALFICHISSLERNGKCSDSVMKRMLKIAETHLIERCGYSSVRLADLGYTPFSCYDENDSTYIDDILGEADYVDSFDGAGVDITANIVDHIEKVILNDDAIIIDSEDSY
jgi:hypothetical protein